ncbi:hypothetical protein BAY61_18525 [Prauserella marina]|uniref:Uncharacterized protein n=1 Tax=Prauserella marina TaxID=530584 RepID=A0A222VRW7_9PSEU|nr:hypothetical protein [Prauserella marina]ASR36667.1 hypothetical protein BAY61_18525 [Prauserella marina]PWV74089.1 hypothetical protein DES30_108263 [Prauserella marina]SDD62754.1 hypothetical protein SAMN05421630_110264 [Prauserella marina]
MVPTTPTTRHRVSSDWLKVLALTLGLPVIIALMLYAFLAPSINSGPKELPVAVAGPTTELTPLEQALRSNSPDAFAFQRHDRAADVEAAITNREAIGGIVIQSSGHVTLYTAAGNGTPYVELMNTIATSLQAQGQSVETIELAPLTEDDPTGIGLAMLGLPLAFGGMASAALMIFLLRGKTLQTLVGLTATSIAAGIVVTTILRSGYGSFDADHVVASLAIAAGVAATSFFVAGLGAVIGIRAIGLGAILTIFIANPLSGLATGWWWLPQPFGEIGQHMPIGAAGQLLRSLAYFDGNGANGAWTTLIIWILAGTTLIVAAGFRKRQHPETPPAEHHDKPEGDTPTRSRQLTNSE